MATTATSKNDTTVPAVVRDPRFRAGRTLVQKGQAEQAVDVFATLLEESRRTFGEDNIETAPAYYEYGNAIFRGLPVEGNGAMGEITENQREAAAATAEKRAQKLESSSTNEESEKKVAANKQLEEETQDTDVAHEEEETNDTMLSLEMMETAYSIIDEYLQSETQDTETFASWATEQVPRVLTGIGDVLSQLQRHADAADAYSRALGHRQEALRQFGADDMSLELLQSRRRVVEANVLIAEELLACPPDQDVVTTETNATLVKATERVDFARGYYDKARDALQETVLLMGHIAGKGVDLGQEKEDICFVSTMVMGVGMNLAELDEQAQQEAASSSPEPKKKKAKTK